MTEDEPCHSRDRVAADALSSQKVYKKSSPNNKLTLYLGTRDLIISDKSVDKIQGVVLAEPDYLQNRKIYGQVTLTFRYGREDEEVMGLKFCNEAIMCLAQLYPPHERAPLEPNTPLQIVRFEENDPDLAERVDKEKQGIYQKCIKFFTEKFQEQFGKRDYEDALIKRLGPNAHPFTMTVTHLAPPSVQLVPAKEYSGAPIGTSYDVRAYAADRSDEKLHRRSTVRMGIRVVQMPNGGSSMVEEQPVLVSPQPPPPVQAAEKQFLLSDGKLKLEASLDKSVYCHGDPVIVNLRLQNDSNRTVRRLKAFIVQHVDVCMFSNGKFKNVVAMMNCAGGKCPLGPGSFLEKSYNLRPVKGATKNWIALEDSYNKANTSLASTVICNSPEERNVFAIYVSYYVKVKATASGMGGDVSVKLPFVLMHSPSEAEPGTEVVAPSEATPPPSPQPPQREDDGGGTGTGEQDPASPQPPTDSQQTTT